MKDCATADLPQRLLRISAMLYTIAACSSGEVCPPAILMRQRRQRICPLTRTRTVERFWKPVYLQYSRTAANRLHTPSIFLVIPTGAPNRLWSRMETGPERVIKRIFTTIPTHDYAFYEDSVHLPRLSIRTVVSGMTCPAVQCSLYFCHRAR